MKSYRIASDTPVEVNRNESGAERRLTNTHKGKASHKELLDEFRKKPIKRTIHSDGFLAMNFESAYDCECGFSGVFKAEKCVKCGKKLEVE